MPGAFNTNRSRLQLLIAILAICLYGLGITAIKLWLYPGWTWRGFFSDLRALTGLFLFGVFFAYWLFELYTSQTIHTGFRNAVRNFLVHGKLSGLAASLLFATMGLAVALLVVGERPIARELIGFADQSNWSYARRYVERQLSAPLHADAHNTLRLFVDVHEMSERDALRGSQSLREDRFEVQRLLEANYDPNQFNSLTFAELSKALYFIEDADRTTVRLDEAFEHLRREIDVATTAQDRARLIARMGEIRLAGRDYASAESLFKQALEQGPGDVLRARILANQANAIASSGNLAGAIELYREAELAYPEGRRAIFYSNYGYLLMLNENYASASQMVERALQINPDDWYSYLNLGLIYDAQGEYLDSLEQYRKVIENSPNPDSRREALIFSGRSLELAGGSPDDYLAYYLRADNRNPAAQQIANLQASDQDRRELYVRMTELLENTNTHGIENYVGWFRDRATEI